MEYRNPARLLALLVLFGASALNAAESLRIYRYTDNNGLVSFNSSVPPQFAKNGYTILDTKGKVLQVVPRTPSRAELVAHSGDYEQQRRNEEARIARKEADSVLLRLYRSPEDIERKRDLNLAEYDQQIADMTVELAELDAEIAQLDPATASSKLADRQGKRDDLDTELLTLTAKRENAAYGFKEDLERLRHLQGLSKNTAAN